METSLKEITCGWCGVLFVKRRPNMIYCTKECCNHATNKKLIERYHIQKNKKNQSGRLCSICSAKLSKYNNNDFCHACKIKESEMEKINLLRSLGFGYINEDDINE